jgi:hypothetical protein
MGADLARGGPGRAWGVGQAVQESIQSRLPTNAGNVCATANPVAACGTMPATTPTTLEAICSDE